MGRRSQYDPELARRVLTEMLEGSTVEAACRRAGVKRGTFLGWVKADRDGLEARYVRVQDLQIDILRDEMMQLADTAAGASKVETRLNKLRFRCERIAAEHALRSARKLQMRAKAAARSIRELLDKVSPQRADTAVQDVRDILGKADPELVHAVLQELDA